MTKRLIPVAAPMLAGNEKAYVMDCLESTWISSTGPYIDRFEQMFAEFCGVRHAVACSNGTTALHLALLALGVGPGDEVIVPTLTFVATANAVTYCGARPVFVDVDADTWNIDVASLESMITPRTRGIIPVHLFGHPAEMDRILAIARRHGLFVVEDSAQAHGAEFRGQRIGSIGDLATFSFYGNKIVTTGEGGMVVTGNDETAHRLRQFRSQGGDPARRYWFPVVGYNYRMTNMTAAIGVAQMENIDWHLQRRREVAAWYRERLGAGDAHRVGQVERPWVRHAWWMYSVVFREDGVRERVVEALAAQGVETRPFVHPLHTLPPYRDEAGASGLPVSERLGRRGLNLPTWAGLSRDDVQLVCDTMAEAVGVTA